jgi:general secretion pathway protein G
VRRLHDEAGFTLIELLIVIVILGILAAIVVFAVGSARDDSTAAACKADRRTFEHAIGAFDVQNGAVPTSLLDLTDGNKYLHADPSITASSKVGDGYTLVYSAGEMSACGVAPPGPPAPPAPPTLAAPTNVAATLLGNNKVHATWSEVSGVGYECTIDTSASPPTVAGTACTSGDLDNGNNNNTRFWVRAVDTAGETSPWVGVSL